MITGRESNQIPNQRFAYQVYFGKQGHEFKSNETLENPLDQGQSFDKDQVSFEDVRNWCVALGCKMMDGLKDTFFSVKKQKDGSQLYGPSET